MSLDQVALLEPFRAECMPEKPNFVDFSSAILKELVNVAGKCLFQVDANTSLEYVLAHAKQCTAELRRLQEIYVAFSDSSETRLGYSGGSEHFLVAAESVMASVESFLSALPDGMNEFCKVSNAMDFFCTQFDCVVA